MSVLGPTVDFYPGGLDRGNERRREVPVWFHGPVGPSKGGPRHVSRTESWVWGSVGVSTLHLRPPNVTPSRLLAEEVALSETPTTAVAPI